MSLFFSLLRVLLLIAMTFLMYQGLEVVLFEEFTFRLTLGENADTGQMNFYIFPWLMIMLVMLLPMLATLLAMRRWLLEKTWRKALAGLLLLIQIGLIVLFSQHQAQEGEISFRPWKPSVPAPAVALEDHVNDPATVAGNALQTGADDSPETAPQGNVAQVAENIPSDEARVLWYDKYLQNCTEIVEKYSAYVKKVKELDQEMDRLKEVIVQRIQEGRMEWDVVLDLAGRVDALIETSNEVMVPKYMHYQEARNKIDAIGNEPPGNQFPWLIKLEDEIDADSARLEEESAKVEAITAELRQMLDN